jgi:hypothetical protein
VCDDETDSMETFTVVTFTRLAEEEKDSMETVTAVNFKE